MSATMTLDDTPERDTSAGPEARASRIENLQRLLGFLFLIGLWAFHVETLRALDAMDTTGVASLTGLAVWVTLGALVRPSLISPWTASGVLAAITTFLICFSLPWVAGVKLGFGWTRDQVLVGMHASLLVAGILFLVGSGIVWPPLKLLLASMGYLALGPALDALLHGHGYSILVPGPATPTFTPNATYIGINGYLVAILALVVFEIGSDVMNRRFRRVGVHIALTLVMVQVLRFGLLQYEQAHIRTMRPMISNLTTP